MNAQAIATTIALLVPPTSHQYRGESETMAVKRYAGIAIAIDAVAKDDSRLARFLVTIAYHESSFRKDIQSGATRGDNGRSWGLYQFNIGLSRFYLIPNTELCAGDIVGLRYENTLAATWAAANFVGPIIEGCDGEPRCVFMRYGGISEEPTGKVKRRIDARVTTYKRISWL